jgi:MFS family permease
VVRLALALGLSQAGFHAFVASLPLAMVAAGRTDPEIGAIMGWAAVVNIGAALVAGGLIDRFGGRNVFLLGVASFAAAALLLALGVATPSGSEPALLLVRSLQGAGLAAVMPSALSLVPGLVSATRLPTALAVVGVAANVSLAAMPPLSLVVLDLASLQAVAALVVGTVLISGLMLIPLEDADRHAREAARRGEVGRLRAVRPTWRSAWAGPLAVMFLFVAHWGVVIGYLPQRAEAAGADIGLFFTGDALALLALRVPAGWLAGRIGSLPLVLAGLVVTAAALSVLLAPATTPLLILAGAGTGAGGALLIPTIMLELSTRSDATDRGSAFGLFSVAFSGGIAVGSIGVAPVFEALGFELALALGIAGCAAAAVIALFDGAMRHPPQAARSARVAPE